MPVNLTQDNANAAKSAYGYFRKAGTVARYHLYFLKQGMLVGSDGIDAADDGEAEELAIARSDGCAVEIWDATRRVRVIPAEAARQASRAAAATHS